ncbi:MAG: response regulator transcription factor [Brevundimonas sp.]|nr:response regulator transcription factor [Brevundimonas sp.]
MTMIIDLPHPAGAPPALAEPREAAPDAARGAPTVMLISRSAATRLRLAPLFEDAGLAVLEAADLNAARQMMSAARLDLIVFECPSLVGDELAFCQMVASGPRTPLMLIAAAADVVDEIVALELGADDLLVGQVADRLVLARVRALLRRTRRHDELAPARKPEAAEWRLDPVTRSAIAPSGRSIVLPPAHAAALRLFLSHPGVVFTCDEGARALGSGPRGAPAFRTTVCRLRQRLDALNCGQPIQTIRGVGYTYVPRTTRPS